MNNIETLKIALEALVDVVHWYQVRDKNDEPLPTHNQNPEIKQAIEAITAIRQVIEQAQQAEPVAWGVDWGKAGDIPCVSIIKRLPDGGIEVLAVEYGPPPRQPLTDEEMKAIWYAMQNIMGWYSFQEIARAIEAKLKEKNT